MKIALLVPSRERIDKKKALAESVMQTVSNHHNVVLYFGIDDDDPTKGEVEALANEYPFIRIVNIANGGKFLGLGRLWNLCAYKASEEILAMIGDDMLFRTKDWDLKIIDEFVNGPQDNVKMVYCNDGRHGKAIAVNFFIHRAYMEITGYLTREEFMVDFIDLWPQQVFSSLGRIKYRPDILIEHLHWSFRKSSKDSIANNLRGNSYPETSQRIWRETTADRILEANKIGDLLGITPDLSAINGAVVG